MPRCKQTSILRSGTTGLAHIQFSPAFQHWHSNDINVGGFRRTVLLSTVCSHTVLWSIMQVWWYIMLLVIATPLISFYCVCLMFNFSFVSVSSLCFFLPPVLVFFSSLYIRVFQLFLHHIAAISSFLLLSPYPHLFIHCHLFTPAPQLLLSSLPPPFISFPLSS